VLQDAAAYRPARLVVVAGDFNLNASKPRVAQVLAGAGFRQRCAKRSPRYDSSAPSPRSRTTIDWAFVRGQMQVDKARVHGSIKASDHCPISFDIGLSV
jgi:endonuclease/exonuclease/phosphatase family metal-dependent hydrolase